MGPVPSEDGTYLLKAYSKQGRQIPRFRAGEQEVESLTPFVFLFCDLH